MLTVIVMILILSVALNKVLVMDTRINTYSELNTEEKGINYSQAKLFVYHVLTK